MSPSNLSSASSLQEKTKNDRAALERSEKVQNQLRDVLATLAQRNAELSAACSDLNVRAASEARASLGEGLEAEVEAKQAELRVAEQECETAVRHLAAAVKNEESELAEAEAICQVVESSEASVEDLFEQRQAAETRFNAASEAAQSLIAADTLDRATSENERLKLRRQQTEDETSELRQALLDSWAARSDADVDVSNPKAVTQDLNNVEEELEWLAKVQQENAAELRRSQRLEREEATLLKRVKELSEEKAALQSAKVDMGSSGCTLREAIASQSEGWLRRVDDLGQQRKMADQDRAKLLTECADLQARLNEISPKLSVVADLEEKHLKAKNMKRNLAEDGLRLQNINAALGVLLLGEDAIPSSGDADASATAEALTRVFQLQKRLNERQEAHAIEKEKLVERIRELERKAAQPDQLFDGADNARPPPSKATPAKTPPLAGTASATSAVASVFRGGLGRLRDAAANAVL